MSKIVVTSYTNPDLDGVSAAYGYAEFLCHNGEDAIAMADGKPFFEAQWVLDRLKVTIPPLVLGGDEKIVIVDCSTPDQLSPNIKLEKVTEIIDHHEVNKVEKFVNAKSQIELVGAAATLVAEKFFKANLYPSKEACFLLFGGIVSNSLNFRAQNSTPRDQQIAEWLKKIGDISNSFGHEMLAAKSDFSKRPLKQEIVSDMSRNFTLNGKLLILGQLEIIGVNNLFSYHFKEIITALNEIKMEQKVDMMILSGLDLEEGKTYFICPTQEEKNLLKSCLKVKENGRFLVSGKLVLRKQITPVLKQKFGDI